MPLPPQCAVCHILGQMPQQRSRTQRGPLTSAEDGEVLGGLEVDLVHEHAGAVDVGQADPHPGQSDHRVGVVLEPDAIAEPQPTRTRGPHDRPRAARRTTVAAPSGAAIKSAVSSCCQSR